MNTPIVNTVSTTSPLWERVGIIGLSLFVKFCPYSVKFDRVSYTVDFSIWILNSYQSMQFIGSILKPIIWYYILCIAHVFILTVYTNNTIRWIKIPTCTVPGSHCMDFSGHLIWKAIPEVRNLTEVQGQISCSPQLSCSYRGSGA